MGPEGGETMHTNVWTWDGQKATKRGSHTSWQDAHAQLRELNAGGLSTSEGHSIAMRPGSETHATVAAMFRKGDQFRRTAADRSGKGQTATRTEEFMKYHPEPPGDVLDAYDHFGADNRHEDIEFFAAGRSVVNPRELHTGQEWVSGEAVQHVAKVPSSVTPEEDLPRIYRDKTDTPWVLDGNHRAVRAIQKRRKLHVMEFTHRGLEESQHMMEEDD